MKNNKTQAVLAAALAAPLIVSSAIPAAAANGAAHGVVVIRGTEIVEAPPGGPVVFRGMAAASAQVPSIEDRAGDPQPATIARGGDGLWLIDPDGTITACTVRGSTVVVDVQRDVIICTSATID